MSVLFETSLGDVIVDVETELCPKMSENFLKLCKTYYYNFNAFFNVSKSFIAQTGDPTSSGNVSQSIYSLLPPTSPSHSPTPLFPPEYHPTLLKHSNIGTLSMACSKQGCGSQFFFTLADAKTPEDLNKKGQEGDDARNAQEGFEFLDRRHAPFGRITSDPEGYSTSLETLSKISESFVDDDSRPLRDIRIRHVIVLDDPFPDPPGLLVPDNSPVPSKEMLKSLRVGDEEELDGEDPEEVERQNAEREARAQALTLEMVGDLPFAEVAPPENVLFVCKLNRVTRSEDLELIFSRFGKILSCEVIKDLKSGDSLQYAFIEFQNREDAERAFGKMEGVLVDDRRIHVDFSQSVSKLHQSWVFTRTGGRPPPNRSKNNNGTNQPPRPLRDASSSHRDRDRDSGGDRYFNAHERKRRRSDSRSHSPPPSASRRKHHEERDYDRRDRDRNRDREREKDRDYDHDRRHRRPDNRDRDHDSRSTRHGLEERSKREMGSLGFRERSRGDEETFGMVFDLGKDGGKGRRGG